MQNFKAIDLSTQSLAVVALVTSTRGIYPFTEFEFSVNETTDDTYTIEDTIDGKSLVFSIICTFAKNAALTLAKELTEHAHQQWVKEQLKSIAANKNNGDTNKVLQQAAETFYNSISNVLNNNEMYQIKTMLSQQLLVLAQMNVLARNVPVQTPIWMHNSNPNMFAQSGESPRGHMFNNHSHVLDSNMPMMGNFPQPQPQPQQHLFKNAFLHSFNTQMQMYDDFIIIGKQYMADELNEDINQVYPYARVTGYLTTVPTGIVFREAITYAFTKMMELTKIKFSDSDRFHLNGNKITIL